MKHYEDLTDKEGKEEYHQQVSKDMKLLEEKGIVTKKKENFEGRPLWETCVRPDFIVKAIELAKKEKGDPNKVIINGQEVLLSFLPFLFFLNVTDEEQHRKAEEYLKQLMANAKLASQ